ncbi:hypothetical protein BOTBODRAFT_132759 [Botryobasidium botryosum FD-172 SS1]|uniref:Polynucleotide 5'-hydroxyl-kinase GRC3 n=1 Tax=Botryobasidium botryosum (strain FD-172 SS1) TaxID=930990 RepID=A0A067MQV7_BOTB1|nr:hypothetical protein BOTBODRAFT_132759 [Botryobasidium botryosum FD-172 SS1]
MSPNRLIEDAPNDDDFMNMDDSETGYNDTPTAPDPAPSVFSTFSGVAQKNLFPMDNEELLQFNMHTSSGRSAIIILEPSESLAFIGTARLTLLRGFISLLGVPLHPSLDPHPVYAPRSHPVPILTSLPNSPRGDTELPPRLQAYCGPESSVVLIQEMLTGVEGIGTICKSFERVFDNDDLELDEAWRIHGFTPIPPNILPPRDLQPFALPPSWQATLDLLIPEESQDMDEDTSLDPLVALVKGPKKSGKSTFARTLLSRLTTRYQKVAFLECDMGQSEFTPGGMVSLHVISRPVFGPPFTHPSVPYRAHYVGASTPRSTPAHYLSSILALLQTYRLELQYPIPGGEEEDDDRISSIIPLVINTHGWVKGLGADLSRDIEEAAEATHVFLLESDAPDDNSFNDFHHHPNQTHTSRLKSPKFYSLEAIASTPLALRYTPADLRALSIISYFHANFTSDAPHIADSWSTAVPLCAQPPWEVDWSVALDQVVLVGSGSEDVTPAELPQALACGLVALVSAEADADAPAKTEASLIPYTQGSSSPPPSTSHCVGLALIRGISPSTHALHLLTPLPPVLLGKCRVLVKGELEMPVWGLLDHRKEEKGKDLCGVEWSKVPYLQWGTMQGVGSTKKRVRRNLMRRGQM